MSESEQMPKTIQTTGSFLPGEIGEIPRATGVYLMFDKRRKVIYVGKAVNLRTRVRQYFAEGGGGDDRPSVPLIRRDVRHIETILTHTEKEAYLLENTLIKRHRPWYNVRLRDDKSYVSVWIDEKEKWPRAVVMRKRTGGMKRGRFFGPYTNARAIREAMKSLQRVYPLRSCTDGVFRNRTRPCMLFQIGRSSAPCVGKVSREQYAEYVRGTVLFLKGRAGDLVAGLRREMLACSERLEFERAAALRDRIEALERSMEAQRVSVGVGGDRDVVGYVEERGRAGVSVLFFRGGELVESLNWVLPVFGMGSAKALSQFLGQFYGEGRLVPGEVLLPGEAEDREIIEEWLGDLRDGRVRVAVPRRGEKLRLVEMANRNAREVLARRLSGGRDAESLLADLARRLRLDGPPARIECYDIATLQGSMSAGAGVVFVDGEPSKGDYRLYKIRGVEGQDDFAMMREVLERRFRRAIQKDEELPDLVVVDGGKGQLGVAVEVLAEMGVSGVGVAALAKEREAGAGRAAPGSERVPERLFLPGRKNPVVFPPHAPSFYLLQYLRDEAHRFVNAYHGKLRRKAHLRSSLEDIPGVGTRRAKALLRHFGSLARIREASAEELEAAPTVSKTAARDIYSYYHSSE